MSDTDKCPKCGSDITYHGTARPAGGGQVARCYNCGFAAEKTLSEEQIVVAAKHRIHELEMTEQILRGGAEHLRRRVLELEARIAQFRDSLRKIVVECNSGRPSSEKIVSIYDIAREEQICAGNFSSQEMSQNGFAADSAKIGDPNQTENSERAPCSQTSEERVVREDELRAQTGVLKCSFAVLAHRWGDTENHTYLVCVVESEEEAKFWAEREEQDRGGKYSCSVWKCGKVLAHRKFTMDLNAPMVNDSVELVTKALIIQGGKTVAMQMQENAERYRRIIELEAQVSKLKESNNAFVRIAQELEAERDMAVKTRNDALDHERARIAAKDEALVKFAETFAEYAQTYANKIPSATQLLTYEDKRNLTKYDRNCALARLAREALRK